jgi:broad specificity phosphatase PhoE
MQQSKVTFYRHAPSTFNIYGDISNDVPITEDGKVDAFTKIFGEFDIVICSTMKRARQTLDASRLIFKTVIFTDLCREILSGNPSNLYNGEENIKETEIDILNRMNKFKDLLYDLAKTHQNIAVISHCVFLKIFTNRKKFDNCASVFRVITP